MKSIQEMLKEAAESFGEVSFYNTYSGRGMYGRQCVGITGSESDCLGVIAEVISDIHNCSVLNDDFEFDETVRTLLCNQSRDNMGYDVIVYWPTLDPIEEENQEINLHNADLNEGPL